MTAASGFAQAIGDYSSGGSRLYVPGLRYDAVGTTGNVFDEALPESPDVAVAVKGFGGPVPDVRLPYDQAMVQLVIRGDQDPETGRDVWYQIFNVVQGAVQELFPDGTYLILCQVMQGSPVGIGADSNGRYRYTMNLQLEVVSPTAQRPAPLVIP